MKDVNIYFKNYKVILLFLFVLCQIIIAIIGIYKDVYLLTLPFFLFIFHNIFFIVNFIYIFKKQPVLIIRESEIIYCVLNLKIDINTIQLISNSYHGNGKLLVIHFNSFKKIKEQLSSSYIKKCFLLNFRTMGRNIIFLRYSLLNIKEKELSNNLKRVFQKDKILF
ncbi:hypothetical protein [Flavobacterium sp.]|jgi:hypothetical protein|uniref:hypothetical protein n=1 Tax=Flavobacterium sp. TaxID=239 RepID=UPI002A81D72E|nr:hypothetical protein [Flavobacterium sp.]